MMIKEFQAGDDVEFHRVVQTIDDMCGADTTNALLQELGLQRTSVEAGAGVSQKFAAARLGSLGQQKLALEGIAFEVSQHCSATADLGIYGYAMLSAGTMGGMLAVGMDFNRLHAPTTAYQIVQRPDGVALQFLPNRNCPEPVRQIQLELVIAAIWQYMLQLRAEVATGELLAVNLDFPAPSYSHLFEGFFQVPVRFDQPWTEMVFQQDFLALPISTGSEAAHQIMTEQSKRLYQRVKRNEGIVDAVRQELLRGVGEGWPDLEQIAEQLALSGRTLRRRLNEHGHSYKQLSNEVRMSLAREYVEFTGLSNEEISTLLGYTESPAFYRAYRNWHGVSPGQSRQVSS